MIPLERWNVERSGTFCDKRTMTWLIQPIVRLLIRHMARQVSRRDAKLEREFLAGPGRVDGDYGWNARLGGYDSSGSITFQHLTSVAWHKEHIRRALPPSFARKYRHVQQPTTVLAYCSNAHIC